MNAHQHDCHQHGCNTQEAGTSTGFLPISLALGLFVTGLFVLDLVPGLSCGAKGSPGVTQQSHR